LRNELWKVSGVAVAVAGDSVIPEVLRDEQACPLRTAAREGILE
jgi:hypothetical protein